MSRIFFSAIDETFELVCDCGFKFFGNLFGFGAIQGSKGEMLGRAEQVG